MTEKTRLILRYAQPLRESTNEQILLLFFKKRQLRKKILVEGSVDEVRLHSKTIFAPALLEKCSRIALVHNHPSGKVFPSERDYLSTLLIAEGAEVLELELLDHVIVTKDDYFSFREAGIL